VNCKSPRLKFISYLVSKIISNKGENAVPVCAVPVKLE